MGVNEYGRVMGVKGKSLCGVISQRFYTEVIRYASKLPKRTWKQMQPTWQKKLLLQS